MIPVYDYAEVEDDGVDLYGDAEIDSSNKVAGALVSDPAVRPYVYLFT